LHVPDTPVVTGESTVDRDWFPSLGTISRRAAPQMLEGALVPLTLFVITMRFAGVSAAIGVSLAWSGVAIARRLRRSERVPAAVLLGAAMLTVRSALALALGSLLVYLAQPIAGSVVVAGAFLVSVPLGRPLAKRFASDFCALPGHVLAHARVHRAFQRVSLMWALIGLANAALLLWLLDELSPSMFLVAQTSLSIFLTTVSVGISVLWIRGCVVRQRFASPAY
jgi:intracellular septation protein A